MLYSHPDKVFHYGDNQQITYLLRRNLVDVEQMKKFRSHPNVMGLAEMMNFPGVKNGDDQVLDKLEAFEGMNIDGHCPLLCGKALNA